MIPWILLIALTAIYCITFPAILKRAEISQANLGYIPVVQFVPMLKAIHRPWWWILLLFCPGINFIVMTIIHVEIGIAFNQRDTASQWKFGALPWYSLFELAFQKKGWKYVGPRDWTGKKKGFVREWTEALLFAVVAASVIRTFTFEAFTIPTPSMEKSMLVGDYLFVSKLSYGPKIPQTPMSVPFMHNALPGGMTNSYVEWFSLPYFRLPGLGDVERYDPVVFNFPNGDTILVDPFFAGHDYHMYLREEGIRIAKSTDAYYAEQEKFNALARANFNEKHVCYSCGQGKPYPIQGTRYRPMDKKENYVKRCIGMPGDNLSIVHGQVMIDGQPAVNPSEMMLSYEFAVKSKSALTEIYKKYKVNKKDRQSIQSSPDTIRAQSSFTAAEAAEIAANSLVYFIRQTEDTAASPNLQMYPNSSLEAFRSWTIDNYGPIHIPKEGETIALTPENIALYTRVIRDYELNTVTMEDGRMIINGQPAIEYTFKQNYYFMMGDNRHQSLDSRYWGFVPEDHIVGKPVFTWFSRSNPEYQEDTSIRWKRMFRFVD